MRTVALVVVVVMNARAVAIAVPITDEPSEQVQTEIRASIEILRSKGLEAAIAGVSQGSTDSERMLQRAFAIAKGLSPVTRNEALLFRDLQWVLRQDASPLTLTALSNWLPPSGGVLVARQRVGDDFYDPVRHVAFLPNRNELCVHVGSEIKILHPETLELKDSFLFMPSVVEVFETPDLLAFFSNEATVHLLQKEGDVNKQEWKEYAFDRGVPNHSPVVATPTKNEYIIPQANGMQVISARMLEHPKGKFHIRHDTTVKERFSLGTERPVAVGFQNDAMIRIAYANGSVATVTYPDLAVEDMTEPLFQDPVFIDAKFSDDLKRVVFSGSDSVYVLAGEESTRLALPGETQVDSSTTPPELRRHRGFEFTCVVLTNDGNTVVVGDTAGNLHLWSGSEYRYRKLKLHEGRVTCLAVGEKEGHIVSGGEDAYVCVVNTSDDLTSGLLDDEKIPPIISRDPANQWMALQTGNTVTIKQLPDRKVLCVVPIGNGELNPAFVARSVGLSPDRQTVSLGGRGEVVHWDRRTKQFRSVPITYSIPNENGAPLVMSGSSISVSPDGASCIAWEGRSWNAARVFDAKTGEERFPLPISGHHMEGFHAWHSHSEIAVMFGKPIESLDFKKVICKQSFLDWKDTPSRRSDYGQSIITGVRIHQVFEKKEKFLIRGEETRPQSADVSGGVTVLSADNIALVYFSKHREIRTINLPENDCGVFGMTGDGMYFLTYSPGHGGIIRIWSCDHGNIEYEVHLHLPFPFPFQPEFDGRHVRIRSVSLLLNE